MEFLNENKPLTEAKSIIDMLQRAVSSEDDCSEFIAHGLFMLRQLILEAGCHQG